MLQPTTNSMSAFPSSCTTLAIRPCLTGTKGIRPVGDTFQITLRLGLRRIDDLEVLYREVELDEYCRNNNVPKFSDLYEEF